MSVVAAGMIVKFALGRRTVRQHGVMGGFCDRLARKPGIEDFDIFLSSGFSRLRLQLGDLLGQRFDPRLGVPS